jgi:hypothetical protein
MRDGPAAGHDVRDDFDDEFRRALSPREIARRRLFVPGVAFVVVGALGLLGLAAGAVVALLDFLRSGRGDERLFILVLVLFLLGVCGPPLFAFVIAGGWCLLNLRRYGLALVAAYVVTGLSIAGLYGILFYPFGIWALILLYRPDIRQEFQRPVRVDD